MSVIRFADPYKTCNRCGAWITGVTDEPGMFAVLPCMHLAGYTDLCPSWGPVNGCACLACFGTVRHGEPGVQP